MRCRNCGSVRDVRHYVHDEGEGDLCRECAEQEVGEREFEAGTYLICHDEIVEMSDEEMWASGLL